MTALTCFFVGFRTDFVTSVRVSVASAGVLALAGLRPAGARKPQGGGAHTLSAPLATSLPWPVSFRVDRAVIKNKITLLCLFHLQNEAVRDVAFHLRLNKL